MALPTDADLLTAARSDASAFRAFYERYAERIYGFHLRRVRAARLAPSGARRAGRNLAGRARRGARRAARGPGEAVRLRVLDDLNADDVARKLGTTPEAARVQGGGFAADQLTSDDVAQSLPAGTAAPIGTDPTCTEVQKDVEYHCVLSVPPAPEISNWKGTVEPTVDAAKHVNGGCRALQSDGLEWECYIRPGGRRPADRRQGLSRAVRTRAGPRLAVPSVRASA